MKPNIAKSKVDPRKLIFFTSISLMLLVLNLVSVNKYIYSTMDIAFDPFLIITRNVANNTNILFTEMWNKGEVLKENIDLKRKIQQYNELEAQNKALRDQLEKLQKETGIARAKDRKLQIVNVVGTQSIFSPNPAFFVYFGPNTEVKQNNVVYYESNTLLGFVTDVKGFTAKVIPYYSPEIKFNIPVQSLRDPAQKGFVEKAINGEVHIKNIQKDAGVNEGDTWVTTNDVTEVPSNLIIGKVKKVNKDPQEAFQEVELEVPYHLSEVSFVLLEVEK